MFVPLALWKNEGVVLTTVICILDLAVVSFPSHEVRTSSVILSAHPMVSDVERKERIKFHSCTLGKGNN